VWESPGVLMPRAPRVATGMLLALALPVLAACRTSPDVAAYVGDGRVSVAELERAVDERLADPDIARYAAADQGTYTRRVLELFIDREIHAEVAERYDISVGDAAVRTRIDELIGDRDAEDVYTQLAQQEGVSRTDVLENVRQQLVREELAAAEGDVAAPSEEELRARYEEVREDLAQLEFGVITVADQPTGDAVLTELTEAPDTYAAVAAQHPGEDTLARLERRSPDDFAEPLAEQLTALAPGTGFTVAVPDVGVVVYFVTRTVYPTFQAVRPQLVAAATQGAAEAGLELVVQAREDLDITVNPRYGVLTDDGQLVRAEGGVVQLLDGPDDADGSGPGD
jgi:hypothetical protein